jgi:hypothetical protein
LAAGLDRDDHLHERLLAHADIEAHK